MSTVLVIQHQETCPPARVGAWLEGSGLTLDVRRPDLGDPVPGRLEHDGLLVLGGTVGATDDQDGPWLPATRALVAHAAGRSRPVLGICLGHQIAAVALGGRIGRNPSGHTVGLHEVTRTAAGDGGGDPLAAALAPTSAVPQWNTDVVLELPDGSEVLAHNDLGDLMMVRFAATVWGIQGHPEASADMLAAWATTNPPPADVDREAMLRRVTEGAGEVVASWRPVVEAWAALVAGPTCD